MNAVDVVRRYLDAWNAHDPEGVATTFVEGGTYSDPGVSRLTGDAIAGYVRGLIEAFPDLSFETVSMTAADESMVATEWGMRGTNTGLFQGFPPTGRAISLRGADFIQVQGDKIASVRGYFDQNAIPKQLGLQVIVQPESLGPALFGTSVVLRSGKTTRPGAFSLTFIQSDSVEDFQRISEFSQKVGQEMAEMPGFLAAMFPTIGNRGYTITAWEDVEDPGQLLRGGTHKRAMEWFFSDDSSAIGMTSVWTLDHVRMMVRCPACGRVVDADTGKDSCQCGEPIPEHPPYW
ncbi:MAG: ester cyclase [Nitrospiraceae bacterium]